METAASEAVLAQDTASQRLLPAWQTAVRSARAAIPEPTGKTPDVPDVSSALTSTVAVALTAIGMATLASARRRPDTSFAPAVEQVPRPPRPDQARDLASDLAPQHAKEIWNAAFQHAARRPRATDANFAKQASWTDGAAAASKMQLGLAADLGLTHKVWITRGDSKVRDLHRKLHGTVVPTDKPFRKWPDGQVLAFPGDARAPMEAWINCIPEETLVQTPGMRASMRRWYEGDFVVLRFPGDDDLTVTPNHPVLRADGSWVAACEIVPGDYLVAGGLRDASVMAPDPQRPPTEARQLHRLAHVMAQAHRVHGRVPDFHGDGRDGNIEVVYVDSELWDSDDLLSGQHLNELGFKFADAAHTSFRGSRAGVVLSATGTVRARLSHDVRSATSLVGSSCQVLSFAERHALHPQTVGGPTTSWSDAVLNETASNDPACHFELGSESLLGDKILDVALQQVLDVDVYSSQGYVSNFDTGHGWFVSYSRTGATGVVTGNCRCFMFLVPSTDGVEQALKPADLDRAFVLAASLAPPCDHELDLIRLLERTDDDD